MTVLAAIGLAYGALCIGIAAGFIACAVITGARERTNNFARGDG